MLACAERVAAALFVPPLVKSAVVFHAAADDCDDGVGRSQDDPKAGIHKVFDDDKGEDDVCYPACRAVVFPEEPPDFLESCLPVFLHAHDRMVGE